MILTDNIWGVGKIVLDNVAYICLCADKLIRREYNILDAFYVWLIHIHVHFWNSVFYITKTLSRIHLIHIAFAI